MKKLIGILLVAAVFASCQQQKKQWFASSTEIDLAKKLDQSFAGADWSTFRASFADTAKIWVNTFLSDPSISADTLTQAFKSAREGMTAVKLSEDAIYEMIEADNGDRWVHRWGLWEATLANGKTYSWVSNANFKVAGGKIVMAGYVLNSLPGYLANQPDPAPAAAK